MCGDTIDSASDKVTVDVNTNDAKRNVNGKLEIVLYPCPRFGLLQHRNSLHHFIKRMKVKVVIDNTNRLQKLI